MISELRQIDGVEVRQDVLEEHDCPMRQYVKECHEQLVVIVHTSAQLRPRADFLEELHERSGVGRPVSGDTSLLELVSEHGGVRTLVDEIEEPLIKNR